MLSQKQALFAHNIARLIIWANKNGHKVTFGEAYRTPEQAALNASKGSGISTSLHTERLAIDLNLFIDERYCADSVFYAPLGKYWKSLNILNRWGGDFRDANGRPKPDGNHFSMEHAGRK